ncbi:tetratricopeptide repeat protein [Fulvivirgaceae bacterium PWU5]|uniref:Tetratricopeptide repeat protein n=2 Tax=Dawidia cretensis TaxID=2782350 RepID=A0AAP2E2X1_9BACT|nr:tetratricopeptide repeat protein [Dawidia cretensis]
MRQFVWCVWGVWLLAACSDSRETRMQRHLIQGNEMVKLQNLDVAERYFREAIKLDSCYADAWNNLGSLYYQQRKFTEALDSYDEALRCRPGYWEAYLNRANAAYEVHEYYRALDDLSHVEKMKPDTVALHIAKGLTYTKLRKFDDAMKSFRRARELDPRNTEIQVNIGTLYYYKKQYDSANQIFDAVLDVDQEGTDANVFNAKAMVAADQGRYDEAKKLLEHAVGDKADDAYFINNYGYVLLMKGDLETGRAYIDASIIIDPYNGWAYRNKGIYYLLSGKPEEALRLFQRAEKADPFVEKIHYYLGEAHWLMGDRDAACKQFQLAAVQGELPDQSVRNYCKMP